MGLDQWAFEISDEDILYNKNIPRDDETTYRKNGEKIAEWRKHPNLQGFFENEWEGDGEFNMEEVECTEEVLDGLETLVTTKSLPHTEGFFFGFERDDDYREKDLDFILRARQAHERGNRVFYTSWW